MNGRSRPRKAGPDARDADHTAGLRRQTEERVLELLLWHPSVAAGLVGQVDAGWFRDPVHAPIAVEALAIYRETDRTGIDPTALLEAVCGRLIAAGVHRHERRMGIVWGLDRPSDVAAAVWGPVAVAELGGLERADRIRRRLVHTVDDLDAGRRPADRVAGRLRKLADDIEGVDGD